jgi:hypothetical protein
MVEPSRYPRPKIAASRVVVAAAAVAGLAAEDEGPAAVVAVIAATGAQVAATTRWLVSNSGPSDAERRVRGCAKRKQRNIAHMRSLSDKADAHAPPAARRERV